MTEVVVVDEWGVVRAGISALLRRAGYVAPLSVSTATAAAAAIAEHQPRLLVVGACPDSAAVDVVRRARAAADGIRTVALVTTTDQRSIMGLFAAGADAVAPRTAEEAELVDAIDHARSARRYLAPALLTAMFAGPRLAVPAGSPRHVRLTAREHAVLRLVADGRTNREVADVLCIGTETVKTHLTSIYTKLSVGRRQAAVGVALQHGLL